ncbi:hypothetical protein ACU80S_19360, partial [Pandoraea sputorum]
MEREISHALASLHLGRAVLRLHAWSRHDEGESPRVIAARTDIADLLDAHADYFFPSSPASPVRSHAL